MFENDQTPLVTSPSGSASPPGLNCHTVPFVLYHQNIQRPICENKTTLPVVHSQTHIQKYRLSRLIDNNADTILPLYPCNTPLYNQNQIIYTLLA
ncbi:hypothetical protein KsCSTR_30730 [Candidatus Kuenenia stuttgartiensis]|uniref:Uncharacterized protein n=1 Tax=Kuenenia stuttgartiensis TaxID=174633 RepID=Q1Q5E7_KUEST|nr:hypothetical protein KsCSTR_30730 [Candidatus Kuenenia stuttgartiensis]CAJ75235.1 unknown protein [Candidatus Kuenenia stuttgartiensis]